MTLIVWKERISLESSIMCVYTFLCHCPHDQLDDFGNNLVSKACTIKSFSNKLIF